MPDQVSTSAATADTARLPPIGRRSFLQRTALVGGTALVLADARILSSLCDAVVYAVRWDNTPRDAVLDGLAELAAIDAPVAGTVLTMLNESRAARYASAGYGTYRRRFSRYGLD